DYGRRSLGWINRVGVERRIQLPGNSVETLVAEIERAIIVKGEWNVRIRWQSCVYICCCDTGYWVNRVEVVAEIRQIELSANFGEIESIKAQSGCTDDGLLAHCRIDFRKTAWGGKGRECA